MVVINKKQTGSKRYLMKNDSLKGQHRINEQIRAKEVRIVGDEVEPKVYPIAQALKMAEEMEADLVEISPNAQPPVCRIIDYSKFLYQLKKRQKEQKAKQVKVNVKEIRFGPQTDDHDYNFKLKHAKGFLEDGDKVKAYVFFKGRSILFKEQGEVLLLRFANTKAEVMSALDELSCGLCDDVLIIGARFPLNINQENVILVDCLDSGDDVNSIQFDHEFATETACNYLISQNRRQIALIHPDGMGFSDQVLLGYKHALEKNFLPFNRNLVFMAATSSSVALQELLNNASTLNFNALLVADEQQAQRVIPQLQAFNKSVPQDIMVFSLAGSLHLPGIPTIPAIEYSMDAMAARIVSWLNEKTQSVLGSYVLRGDLIIPQR